MSVLKWTKVSDMPASSVLLKLLLYGDSGTGKTWCASTSPNPCFLLTEPNGLPTIRAANPGAVVIQADEAHGGMNTVREFLRAAKDGSLKKETGCETVVLDSLNELQRMIRDEIMATKKGTAQEAVFSLQDWGTLTDRMRGLVRAFRDLPFHIVGITHADAQQDEAAGTRHVLPMFMGRSLPNEIAGYFSAVGLMYRDRSKADDGGVLTHHRVLLKGPPSVVCKGLPGLEPIEEPDLRGWLARMAAFNGVNGVDSREAPDPINKSKARSRSRRRSS
jgi:hypothetical protein